jgi:DNA segregation ATPase FtsK/SpoIIIE, S-DNA-T family
MTPGTITALLIAGGGAALAVWVLNKIGRALTAIAKALATLAVVFLALWFAVKLAFWLVRWVVRWLTTTRPSRFGPTPT